MDILDQNNIIRDEEIVKVEQVFLTKDKNTNMVDVDLENEIKQNEIENIIPDNEKKCIIQNDQKIITEKVDEIEDNKPFSVIVSNNSSKESVKDNKVCLESNTSEDIPIRKPWWAWFYKYTH